jgi:hypothetical protein
MYSLRVIPLCEKFWVCACPELGCKTITDVNKNNYRTTIKVSSAETPNRHNLMKLFKQQVLTALFQLQG